MSQPIRLKTPLSDADVEKLKAGDKVLLNGVIYTGRDAAHKRLFDLLKEGKPLPIDIKGQVIYYVDRRPAKPGQVIGSAGPDDQRANGCLFSQTDGDRLQGHDRKGDAQKRSRRGHEEVQGRLFCGHRRRRGASGQGHQKSQVVAYEDSGPEAINRLEVEDFPVIVVNDTKGNDCTSRAWRVRALK